MDLGIQGKEFGPNDDLEGLSKLTNGDVSIEEIKSAIELSIKAKENSYSPYSQFRVGCALITKEGKFYQGANIENLSYGLTCCAERCAIFNSAVNGERQFKAAIVSTDMDVFITPCGACRQVLSEFNVRHIILLTKDFKLQYYTLNYLIPSEPAIYHLRK